MEHLRSVAAIALFSFAAPASPQNLSESPHDPPSVVRTLPQDDRMTIPIHIDGKGPWHFIVDTGSQRTVISRDLAEKLALPAGEKVTVVSMAGEADAQTVAVSRLQYGNITVSNIEAPVLEADHIGAHGLLGLDSLHARRLLINFRSGRIEINSSRRAWRDPNAIIVEAQRRKGQLILLHSTVNGTKVNIILDTGTRLSVGNLALMDKLIRKKRAPALASTALVSVTGEILNGRLGRLQQVRMGSILLNGLPVMFADAPPFAKLGLQDKPALLLGMDALKGFDRIAIDFGRGKVDFLLPDGSALDRQQLAAKPRAAG